MFSPAQLDSLIVQASESNDGTNDVSTQVEGRQIADSPLNTLLSAKTCYLLKFIRDKTMYFKLQIYSAIILHFSF